MEKKSGKYNKTKTQKQRFDLWRIYNQLYKLLILFWNISVDFA